MSKSSLSEKDYEEYDRRAMVSRDQREYENRERSAAFLTIPHSTQQILPDNHNDSLFTDIHVSNPNRPDSLNNSYDRYETVYSDSVIPDYFRNSNSPLYISIKQNIYPDEKILKTNEEENIIKFIRELQMNEKFFQEVKNSFDKDSAKIRLYESILECLKNVKLDSTSKLFKKIEGQLKSLDILEEKNTSIRPSFINHIYATPSMSEPDRKNVEFLLHLFKDSNDHICYKPYTFAEEEGYSYLYKKASYKKFFYRMKDDHYKIFTNKRNNIDNNKPKQTPLETIQTPLETIQVPLETIQTPLETNQTPLETIQTPLETIQTLPTIPIISDSGDNPSDSASSSTNTTSDPIPLKIKGDHYDTSSNSDLYLNNYVPQPESEVFNNNYESNLNTFSYANTRSLSSLTSFPNYDDHLSTNFSSQINLNIPYPDTVSSNINSDSLSSLSFQNYNIPLPCSDYNSTLPYPETNSFLHSSLFNDNINNLESTKNLSSSSSNSLFGTNFNLMNSSNCQNNNLFNESSASVLMEPNEWNLNNGSYNPTFVPLSPEEHSINNQQNQRIPLTLSPALVSINNEVKNPSEPTQLSNVSEDATKPVEQNSKNQNPKLQTKKSIQNIDYNGTINNNIHI